jgi:D-alanine-D-alanine ligase
MKIGLTYDLKDYYLAKGYTKEEVAEFDVEETVEAIEKVLKERGFKTDRIGCLEQLMPRLLKGDRWDLVFNIAEGMYGIAREAQIPALLDAYRIPYTFSSSEVLAVALDKGMTNAIMKGNGIRCSDFHVVRNEQDIEDVNLDYPLFVKPIAEGTSKGVTQRSVIRNYEELDCVCRDLLTTFKQPVLVENYLSGREFTVGMLGSGDNAKAIGVMEVKLFGDADKNGYTYDNKQLYEDRVSYEITDEPEVSKLALSAWKVLNCQDAGRIDIRMDSKGIPHFLEVNPLAGLNPRYSDLCIMCKQLNFAYSKLINSIVDSALQRAKLI